MTEKDINELLGMIQGIQPGEKIGETERDGLTVSTIYAHDLHEFETAIEDTEGFHPVERYQTHEEAVEGHQKWVDKLPTLETITKLGYGSIIAPNFVILERKEEA